jgi:sugar-specific transcriptional regulator TrmB
MKQVDLKYRMTELGLTDYESRGYLAMIQKHDFTAAELSRISGIPRTRIYEILQKLIQKGLCVEILGGIKKYKAVAPKMALARLIEYQKAELTAKENLANSISSILQQEFIISSTNQNPLDYIELLKDPKHVAHRFMELVEKSQNEILVFVKPPFSNPKEKLEKQTSKGIEAVQRKIVCKALYEISKGKQEREWQFEQIDMASKAGEHSRIIESLPLKLAIFDESKVIFAMEDYHPAKGRQTSLVIKHHALAKGLKILFDTLWKAGRDYHDLLKIE